MATFCMASRNLVVSTGLDRWAWSAVEWVWSAVEWVWSAVVEGHAASSVSQGGEEGGVANSSSGQHTRKTCIKGMGPIRTI